MELERNCINICSITGPEKNIEDIDKILNYDFSMNNFIPISKYNEATDRLLNWGCEADMELITYISCNFIKPQTIDMVYSTDIPNLLFLRQISKAYDLTIEHAFNDEVMGYIGYNKIVNGELIEVEYEEDETSKKYQELQLKYNFINSKDIEEINTNKNNVQHLISMKDILELAKKK